MKRRALPSTDSPHENVNGELEGLVNGASATNGFKHATVAQALRDGISRGVWKTGDRIPSEQELANRFGVAYMTARQAVSSLVTEGVLERVPRRGTFVTSPDQAVARAQAPHVSVLLQGAKPSLDPLSFSKIIDAFEAELSEHGFETSIYDYKVASRDGFLPPSEVLCCIVLNETQNAYATALRQRGHRVLAINRSAGPDPVPFVSPDNQAGAKLAVEHLIELGHRRIGFVRGSKANLDAMDRRQGYLLALAEHGIEPGPECGDNFDEEAGYKAARQIMHDSEKPTALFCASDVSAIGAMKALRELGYSVPRDISVVGFGDFPVARYWEPGLTTVRLPLTELGTQAARAALRLFNHEEVQSELLPVTLVERHTTASRCALRAWY